jgi:hypothetical protein
MKALALCCAPVASTACATASAYTFTMRLECVDNNDSNSTSASQFSATSSLSCADAAAAVRAYFAATDRCVTYLVNGQVFTDNNRHSVGNAYQVQTTDCR